MEEFSVCRSEFSCGQVRNSYSEDSIPLPLVIKVKYVSFDEYKGAKTQVTFDCVKVETSENDSTATEQIVSETSQAIDRSTSHL